MKTLGIDIGTTTISAVVTEDNHVISSHTVANNSFLDTGHSWEKIQDPKVILSTALTLIHELTARYPSIERIGFTGQQHGILYLDKTGKAVTPLYTWQDERGSLPFNSSDSYTSYLSELTGEPLSTGYGIVTHFYNLKNNLIPENASVFCTIADYIAMTAAGLNAPVVHPSNAASFGLFDLATNEFCTELLHNAKIDGSFIPHLSVSSCIGMYQDKIPVYTAIGDNQASFLGATQGKSDCILVNIGTGAQVSIYSRDYLKCNSLEVRPYINEDYLLVGSSLCGGRAYALLERFFRKTAEMIGTPVTECYSVMSAALDTYPEPRNIPVMRPLFQGTRANPGVRADISGLDTENFLPLHFIYATMYGIIDELYSMYKNYKTSDKTAYALYGSGNGLRLNPHLCQILEKRFQLPLILSSNEEEAACGAALFATLK